MKKNCACEKEIRGDFFFFRGFARYSTNSCFDDSIFEIFRIVDMGFKPPTTNGN